MHDTARGTLIIVYFDLGIGGVQRKIIDIVNLFYTLLPFQTTRIAILLDAPSKKLLADSITNPNVAIYHKPAPWVPFWLYIAWHILITPNPHILSFLALPTVEVYKAMRLFFWKKVRVINSQDVITSHAYGRGDFSPKIHRQIPAALSESDGVLVPSEPIFKDLIDAYLVPATRIHIVPNWTTLTAKRTREYKKNTDLLYIGRFDKEKRLTDLVSSVPYIAKVVPSVSVHLMGEGACKQDIRSQIKSLGLTRRISITDPKPAIETDIRHTKLAVYMSKSEGIPMFLLEAMALGVPVVTNNFPGARSVVLHGKSGYVCSSKKEFIQYIVRLLNNDHERVSMGACAQKRVRTMYTSTNIHTYVHMLFPDIRYDNT